MSLIACTNTCAYQEEGYCRLEQAAANAVMPAGADCVHFVGRTQVPSGAMAMVSQTRPTALG